MAATVAKFVGGKVLKSESFNHFGVEDPYYVYLTIEDKHGKKKTVTKRRYPPEALSANDKKIYKKVLRRQHRLDNWINLGVFKFGYSAIIGLIPVIGDFVDYAFAQMLIRECRKIDGGMPRSLEVKMQAHAMTDLLVGFIPVAGDVVDAIYKANKRNAKILVDFLDKRALEMGKAHEGTATPVGGAAATRGINGQSDPAAPKLPNRRSMFRPTAGPGHGDEHEIVVAPDMKFPDDQETGVTHPPGYTTQPAASTAATPAPAPRKQSRFSKLFMTDRKAQQGSSAVV